MWNDFFKYLAFWQHFSFLKCKWTLRSFCRFAYTCTALGVELLLFNLANCLWKARNSNFRHRPIGVGVQGLADTFLLMRHPFESEEAQELNRAIFETIYYAALKTSCELAKELGPYETYEGSPVSKGVNISIAGITFTFGESTMFSLRSIGLVSI